MALKRGPTRGRDNANAALNLKDCQQKAGKTAATGFLWNSRGSLKSLKSNGIEVIGSCLHSAHDPEYFPADKLKGTSINRTFYIDNP